MNRFFSPGTAGLLSAVLAFTFFIIFVFLGFVQPGYDHLRNTISVLAVGKYGWVQVLNFFVLAFSFLFLGYGLGKVLTGKEINGVFGIFALVAGALVMMAFFPTDKLNVGETFRFTLMSPTAKIHYLVVLIALILAPLSVLQLIKSMQKKREWNKFIPYTIFVLVFNCIGSIIWFVLLELTSIPSMMGILQKILAVNMLAWMIVVGHTLWKREKETIS